MQKPCICYRKTNSNSFFCFQTSWKTKIYHIRSQHLAKIHYSGTSEIIVKIRVFEWLKSICCEELFECNLLRFNEGSFIFILKISRGEEGHEGTASGVLVQISCTLIPTFFKLACQNIICILQQFSCC